MSTQLLFGEVRAACGTLVCLLLLAATAQAEPMLLTTVHGTFYHDGYDPPPDFNQTLQMRFAHDQRLHLGQGQMRSLDFRTSTERFRRVNHRIRNGAAWEFDQGGAGGFDIGSFVFTPIVRQVVFWEYEVIPSITTPNGYSLAGSGMHVDYLTLMVGEGIPSPGRPRIEFVAQLFGSPGEVPEPNGLGLVVFTSLIAWRRYRS